MTPRIECTVGETSKVTYTSLSDLAAVLTASEAGGQVGFDARGRLLTAAHKPVAGGEVRYRLKYTLSAGGVGIVARVDAANGAAGSMRFILPVISRSGEAVVQADARTVRIAKAKGTLVVRTDAARGFEAAPKERTFNLVAGFECVALAVGMELGKEVRIQVEVAGK